MRNVQIGAETAQMTRAGRLARGAGSPWPNGMQSGPSSVDERAKMPTRRLRLYGKSGNETGRVLR